MKDIILILRTVLLSVLGWAFIAPLASVMPRRKDWVAVIGRQDGRFLDNAKYFFLHANSIEPNIRFVYITGLIDVEGMIRPSGLQSICYPSLAGSWFLLRCNTAIVDESNWFRSARRFFLIKAEIIQLWHGIGFKRIELDRWRNETGSVSWASSSVLVKLRLFLYFIVGRWVRYSAVISTSFFYEEKVFKPAFLSRVFLVAGYPRNDFAQTLQGEYMNLAWCNVDTCVREKLEQWQAEERHIVMVTPTFRDSGNLPMQLDSMMLKKINDFAEKNKVEFVFKFHPSDKNADRISGKHFHVCARDSDIYPLFPYLSALVTDYSSISMDFLLVDKPLLFLIPENDDYVEKDRQLQFDPRSMMPGPVVSNWSYLLDSLLNEWEQDSYKVERATLRSKAFDDFPQSDAVPKIIALMRENNWVSTQSKK